MLKQNPPESGGHAHELFEGRQSPYVCPLCGSVLRRTSKIPDGEFLRCELCVADYPISKGIPIFIPPDAYQRFPISQVKATYDRAYGHRGIMGTHFDPEYSRVTKTTLLELCQYAPNSRILDVGTGDGDLWEYASHQHNWYAIDISETGVRRAVQRFPSLKATVAISEWLPYPDGYFGAIIAADTLEHTFDLELSLKSVKRVLATDGTFAFSVPAPDSLRKWGYNRLVRRIPSFGFIFRLGRVVLYRAILFGRPNFQPLDRDLSLDQWERVVKDAGFTIVTAREWPVAPLQPIVYLISAKVT